MTYRILSPRVGDVGAPFTPTEGVNVAALIDGGFIAEDNTPTHKPAKKDIAPHEETT